MKTRILLALAALATAGCDLPSAIDGYTDDVRLEFSAREDRGPQLAAPELTFTGGDGEIVVEGLLNTADPCRTFSADARSENGRLELVVRIQRRGELCIAVLGRFAYTARLLDLAPGTYDLAVVHEFPGSGWGSYRRETQVTVR
jgi:hypothetical protein